MQIEFIKKLRRAEIRCLIEEVRYYLDLIVRFGGSELNDICADKYIEIGQSFKNRNNFKGLR